MEPDAICLEGGFVLGVPLVVQQLESGGEVSLRQDAETGAPWVFWSNRGSGGFAAALVDRIGAIAVDDPLCWIVVGPGPIAGPSAVTAVDSAGHDIPLCSTTIAWMAVRPHRQGEERLTIYTDADGCRTAQTVELEAVDELVSLLDHA